ncbi:HDOD domain-containing protein [Treponema sp.]|uniref:HDOD domain-containing protein n=1 Tax=Treponema sp. TaxID=166 RepID=UPI00298EA96D|nr:HDOD domain-containing protein [Treponema sp.]MCQ2242257.1 HDOD domain-containing protein [Treponema sp.]
MAQIKKIKVDKEKVNLAIQTGIPLTVTTYTLPIEMEGYITDILSVFLKLLNMDSYYEGLAYCVKELVNNAKKANTKRIYFAGKGLNINNIDDYDRGMQNFKMDTITNINYYLEEQRKQGYFIKTIFQMRNNKIKVEIRNRAALTVFEYKRIHDKITRAHQYTSIEEGISQLLDESEGAGLGLVIMILILRKFGLTEDNYQVLSEKNETINRIIIPLDKTLEENINTISREFANLVDSLPEFPENITQINNLINSPTSKMSDIARRISNDVALTGELLKMVNSAAYMLPHPCQNIEEAVKYAGLRGIKNLLFSIGSMENLVSSSSEKSKKLWDHSYQVGFYAYNLARNFCKKDRSNIEDSYVCGLLHDMGKIVFENARPNISSKLEDICKKKHISKEIFENLIAGCNHGEIGACIAEKWNFPQILIDVLRYHHNPECAPESSKELCNVIYLADMMAHYSEGLIDFAQIDSEILEYFNISTEEQLQGIADRLASSFKR